MKLQIADIVALAQASHPQSKAAIELELLADYPGLEMNADHEAIQLLTRLAPGDTQLIKVAFGTEAGLFSQRFDSPIVVCGPGSIQQAHKPDEYCHWRNSTSAAHY
ncbi:M20/M25/M40 family metallo-hydrolase [Vibrio sp. PP-XX7]